MTQGQQSFRKTSTGIARSMIVITGNAPPMIFDSEIGFFAFGDQKRLQETNDAKGFVIDGQCEINRSPIWMIGVFMHPQCSAKSSTETLNGSRIAHPYLKIDVISGTANTERICAIPFHGDKGLTVNQSSIVRQFGLRNKSY